MAVQNHMIYRQVLDFSFHSRKAAVQAQEEISHIYHHDLLPVITQVFDENFSGDVHVRIDRLEIHLGRISSSNLKEGLTQKVYKKLTDELVKVLHKGGAAILNLQGEALTSRFQDYQDGTTTIHCARTFDLHLFIHFLETGRLPWWAPKGCLKSLPDLTLKVMREQPEAIMEAIGQRIIYQNCLNRLIYQMPDKILIRIIDLVHKGVGEQIRRLHKDLYVIQQQGQLLLLNHTNFRLTLWQCAFEFFFQNKLVGNPLPITSGAKTMLASADVKPAPSLSLTYAMFLINELSECGPRTRSDESKQTMFVFDTLKIIEKFERAGYAFKTRSLKYMAIMLLKELTGNKFQGFVRQYLTGFKIFSDNEFLHPMDSRSNDRSGESKEYLGDTENSFLQNESTPESSAGNGNHLPTEQRSRDLPPGNFPPKQHDGLSGGSTSISAAGRQDANLKSAHNTDDKGIHIGKYERGRKKYFRSADAHAGDGIDIHNAGLVLLWPFFLPFFDGLGLLKNKAFITEDAARRAALLLQYIVSRETTVPEYDLILNKLLCGIDIDDALPGSIELSDIEKEETDNLLETVAKYWTALKSTSGDGLRRSFLIRDGILRKHSNGWKLSIPRSSIDILIDRIPWNISIIKLPWCDQMIYVEW